MLCLVAGKVDNLLLIINPNQVCEFESYSLSTSFLTTKWRISKLITRQTVEGENLSYLNRTEQFPLSTTILHEQQEHAFYFSKAVFG